MEQVLQWISQYGFAVVAYLLLFWKMLEDDKAHKEEVGKLSDALNNNTKVLERLEVILSAGNNQ